MRLRNDRGAVTVEAALALCALVVVFGIALAGISAVAGQLQCSDAAREAARLMARGEGERAQQAVSRIAPEGADLQVSITSDEIVVQVSADPAGGLLPGVRLRAEAFAVAEPQAAVRETAHAGS